MLNRRLRMRGAALAVTLMLLLLLSVICLTLGTLGLQHLNVMNNYSANTVTSYAAIAGFNEVADRLYGSTSWNSGFSNQQLTGIPSAFYSVTFNRNDPFYSTNNVRGFSDVTGYGKVSVPPGCAFIISTGTETNDYNAKTGKLSHNYLGKQRTVIRRVAGIIKAPAATSPPWNYAVFANDTISFSGGRTGSIDSRVGSGPYIPRFCDGSIGTNSVVPGAITLGGNGAVNGNAFTGPGGDPSIVFRDSSRFGVSGGTVQPLSSVELYPIIADFYSSATPSLGDANAGSLAPGKYDNLTVNGGNEVTLSAGDYSFQGIVLSGHGTICINAPGANDRVRIYVRGTQLDISGNGIANSSYQSTKCQIYTGPSLTRATVTGGSTACYALFAPNAIVTTVGGGTIFGSIICNSCLNSGGANVFYDKALSQLVTPIIPYPQTMSMFYYDETSISQ